jgi:pre-mRNA-splicing factor RBM22/SLT11
VDNVNELAHAQLKDMARMEPRYERNLAKLCSFFARGECDRGDACPFRHELPKDRNDPLSKQNTKDRFFGTSDPVANKILGRKRQYEQEQAKRDDDEGYDKARATLYIRYQGDPPFPVMEESVIRDHFYAFGEIAAVRPQSEKGQAFVEYTQPEAAELAIATMNRKELESRTIYVSWARAPKRGEAGPSLSTQEQASSGSSPANLRPMPPPGGVTRKAMSTKFTAAPRPNYLTSSSSLGRVNSSVPRPGGVPSVGAALPASKRATGSVTEPLYPSADPSRLGTKASPAL